MWDEEKQEWVDRWGWKGANKAEEKQWLTVVPANAGAYRTACLYPHTQVLLSNRRES